MTVEELGRRLSSAEFAEWMAVDRIRRMPTAATLAAEAEAAQQTRRRKRRPGR